MAGLHAHSLTSSPSARPLAERCRAMHQHSFQPHVSKSTPQGSAQSVRPSAPISTSGAPHPISAGVRHSNCGLPAHPKALNLRSPLLS
ncbi:hypothetical protein VTO73DRAFT_9103 [Trametes versicolor]